MIADGAKKLVQLSINRYGREKIASHLDVHPRTVKRWEDGLTTVPKGNLLALEQLSLYYNSKAPVTGDFTFIDLFAGIGGIRRNVWAHN